MNKDIMRQAGLGDFVKSVESGKCPTCKQTIDVKTFTDALSLREFGISGMCQKCQNEIFKGD